jgi:hypothetical protein
VIYVPRYEPQILYEPGYVAAPVTYWPDPYPYYWNPAATFFAGAVTGAVWAAAVDWDDWGVWGGNWKGDIDIDVDCNKCFNNIDFDGNINFNDIDWKNVDRSKIKIDKNQFTKIDRTNIKNDLTNNKFNNIQNKAVNLDKARPAARPASAGTREVKDIRKSTLEGLKGGQGGQGGNKLGGGQGGGGNKLGGGQGGGASKLDLGGGGNKAGGGGNRPGGGGGRDKGVASLDLDRPVGKAKPGSRPDNRPKELSPLGDKGRGKDIKFNSDRGAKAMGGGGMKRPQAGGKGGGGGHKKISRGGGGGGGGKGRGGGRRR